MSSAIITTIDSAGRLVVPKEIREQARLIPGMPLRISCRDGHVEIEPAPRQVTIVRKGRISVALPAEAGETLSTTTVRETAEAVRHGKS